VGHIVFPLGSLSIAPMEGEVGQFICQEAEVKPTRGLERSNSSFNAAGQRDGRVIPKKVVEAAMRVEKEGRQGPRMTVNVRIKESED
jgi:hypothetical protein